MAEKGFLIQAVQNPVIYTTFFGWLVAQTIKVILGVIRERRFNFKWFVGTGGMPSAHASGAAALATAVGIYSGPDAALFGVTLMFAIVVICDAQGVRRSTGQQAEILNAIMEDIYWKKKIKQEKLKELIGHTPVQVFSGIFIGILTAFLIFYF